jgi:membrane protease YdiL (CAAX protease family)
MNLPPPTANWTVIKLLWKAARRRVVGRGKRQQEVMQRKKGSAIHLPSWLSMVLLMIITSVIHAALGWMLISSADTARIVDCERHGKLVIRSYLHDELRALSRPILSQSQYQSDLDVLLEKAADWRQRKVGGSEKSQLRLVKDHFDRYGVDGFICEDEATATSRGLPITYWPIAGFILLWWLLMLVFQGEGLELDIQRRRHPMWEWVQSHPVRPVAAFSAELMAPLMANPFYLTAPVFWWMVIGLDSGLVPCVLGGLVVGLLFACAASSLNKALEISAMLRLAPRSRGAVLGLMSWFGYSAMMLSFFVISSPGIKYFLVKSLAPLGAVLPEWPVRALVFGWGETQVLWQMLVSEGVFAGVMAAGSIWLAWWGANQGLQAASGASAPVRKSGASGTGFLAKNPLYRKEMLWFWRDKSAVVQCVLIPLTMAGFQLFNMRGIVSLAASSWSSVCGAAIICGTYFLLTLGPRSLASEGAALWIATTWPHGMEDLLKAKARLWWLMSSVVVGIIMAVAVFLFPADLIWIVLVAVAWLFFGHSLSQKSVTLATAPSSSGEPEPASQGQQWAAFLGSVAFGSGVISGNWSVAVTGLVFSWLLAAAMWQNFRARLPFLFDRWSEKLPSAPSLMHSIIGIAVMVEVIGLTTVLTTAFAKKDNLPLIHALTYGLLAIMTMIGMDHFLKGRGVKEGAIWRWEADSSFRQVAVAYGAALIMGVVLSGFAMVYMVSLRASPLTHDLVLEMDRLWASQGGAQFWAIVLAVLMAPVAEEYLFRGLLFRALDREWGGWKAILASAAFFAIYHPLVSWLPVFAVGVGSAWLFKKTGLLGASVLLHLVYNALVILLR